MSKHVAFLRGINVGGKTIKMDALRKMFEVLGYENVRTLLASGNVIFESKTASEDKLRAEIETGIKKSFGHDVHVILRSEKEIQELVKSDPFKGVKVTPKTRLYITLLSESPKSNLKTPHKSMDGEYIIREINNKYVVNVLGPQVGTPDVMDFLGKEFGNKITTRNWNTMIKIHKAMG